MTAYRARLRRSVLNRVLGGVCGGIGDCLGVSGWWVRALFFALALTNVGFAILLYALLWAAIPRQRLRDLPPLVRPGDPPVRRYTHPESALIVGALSVLVGAVILIQQTGVLQAAGGSDVFLPLMLLLLALVMLLKHLRGVA